VANRLDTRFNLASMHKMVTGVAVAQLVAAGKLSYEDPMSKFFPGTPQGSPYTKIRIKHLVSHTSGLPFWYSSDNPPDYSGRPETNDDILREVSEEKLQFEPGAHYQYSNLAFHLLGAVIARAAGMSYENYVRENIYKPAGMENGDAPKDAGPGAFAFSYRKQFDEQGRVSFHRSEYAIPEAGPGHAAGGGWASAGDLLKFYQALRSGELLGDAALQEVLSPKPDLNSQRYGYGFDIDPVRGSFGHSGGGLGVSDYSEMFTGSAWTSIVMANYTENGAFEVCEPVVLKIRELLDSTER
jgi:CubicO group peptidase (beta-lactamase class C family)